MNTRNPQNDPNGWHAVEEMYAYASFLLEKRNEQHADWPPGLLRTWPWPPHMLGAIARYIYITLAIPIQELAIAAAIAVVAAICRDGWRYRGSALDHYVLALRDPEEAGIMPEAIANLVRQLPIAHFGIEAALVESTPDLFCSALYTDPRSWIFDCAVPKPPLNENRFWPLPKRLRDRLCFLIQMPQGQLWMKPEVSFFTPQAKKELPTVLAHCQRERAFAGHNLAVRSLWDGAAEKVNRLAALSAVASGFLLEPEIDVDDLGWAFEMLIITNKTTTDLLELRALEAKGLKRSQ